MRKALALWLCCALACSGASSAQPPQPASDEVDPFKELVEIPDALCPNMAGWIAMTPRVARLMLDRDIERERQNAADLAKAQTAQRIAESRAGAAIKAAESADWWSRWGLLIGLSAGGVVGIVAGAAIGVGAAKYGR